MQAAGQIIMDILRDAWGALVGLIVLLAILGLVYYIISGTLSSFAGAHGWASKAILAIAGLVGLVLYAFLAVPAIVRAAVDSTSGMFGCGPIAELSGLAAYLIGGLTGIHLLVIILQALVATSMGSSGEFSTVIIETMSAVAAMLLVSAAGPVAAAFFGVCTG